MRHVVVRFRAGPPAGRLYEKADLDCTGIFGAPHCGGGRHLWFSGLGMSGIIENLHRGIGQPMTGKQRRPLLIVFEGIDGSGKTTQAKMLSAALESSKIDHILTFEPSDGVIGRFIRSARSRPDPEEEERLFTEDRRDHVERVILPALKANRTVICDRYVYSSVAYQGARGIDTERILAQNRLFAPEPDIIFFLSVPVSVALARIRSARAHGFSVFEEREALDSVDAIYRGIADPLINRLDGTLSPDSLHERVLDAVKHLWSGRGGPGKRENA